MRLGTLHTGMSHKKAGTHTLHPVYACHLRFMSRADPLYWSRACHLGHPHVVARPLAYVWLLFCYKDAAMYVDVGLEK